MLKLGFLISISGFITLGASYVVQIFISNTGGVDQVGLYLAGFAIINTYVGLIFSAMSTDYFPRLSAISHNNEQSRIVINEQAEIAILILAPVIIVFLVFSHWMVILLYSYRFISVTDMILWAALGMFFKAASWSIAFIFLAKGANKLFFWNEFITNTYLLALNLLGYKLLGLTGLGISFMVSYLLYVFQVYFIAKIKYGFLFHKAFYKIFSFQLILAVICFWLVKFLSTPFSYIGGVLVIVISFIYSIKELDKRLDIKSIFIVIKKRLTKSE
jgi:O-antigen/teichoic acid export membrane protein